MKNKHKLEWVIAVSFLLGITLLVISLFMPPKGVIDKSVVEAAGSIFSFSAILEALFSNKGIKLSRGAFHLFIGDTDDNKQIINE